MWITKIQGHQEIFNRFGCSMANALQASHSCRMIINLLPQYRTTSLRDNLPGATNVSTPVNGKTKKVDDMIKEARNEMSEVVKLFKDSLAEPKTKSKTVAQDFFEILAKQSDEANLSPLEFSSLQIKRLNILNETLRNRQQN